jgi:hypothetical protein
LSVVGEFAFEQLGVREDDSELIIEAVEECSKIARIWGIRAIFGHRRTGSERLTVSSQHTASGPRPDASAVMT